jgi:hypothetical protein
LCFYVHGTPFCSQNATSRCKISCAVGNPTLHSNAVST